MGKSLIAASRVTFGLACIKPKFKKMEERINGDDIQTFEDVEMCRTQIKGILDRTKKRMGAVPNQDVEDYIESLRFKIKDRREQIQRSSK